MDDRYGEPATQASGLHAGVRYSTATDAPVAGKLRRRLGALAVVALALGLAACETRSVPLSAQRAPSRPAAPAQQLPQPPKQQQQQQQQAPQVAAVPPAETAPKLDLGEAAAPSRKITRIGVLLPLSGEAAAAGQALRDAALLAQFDVSNPGLVLQFYDTRGTADGARAAAAQAQQQGASLLVGPLFSQSVQAVTSVAQAHNLPVLSFSSDPTASSNDVFVTGFLIQPQVERVIGYAAEQGYERFAVLAPDTAYGHAAADAAAIAVQANGKALVKTAFFDPAKASFSPVVKDLANYTARKAALDREKAKLAKLDDAASVEALKRLTQQDTLGDVDFDALLLPMADTSLRQALSLLKYYDIDPTQVRLLGTMLWQDDNLSREDSLRGAWFPAASRAGYDRFVAHYTETYGRAPSQLGSLAYDAVALAAALSQQADQPWQYLTATGGFIGVNGAFRLNPDGRVERMLAVREIGNGETHVISPAPTRFSQAR